MRCLVSWLPACVVVSLGLGQGPVFEPESLIPGTSMHRCGTPTQFGTSNPADAPDCGLNLTNPAAWAPTTVLRIPVVVHVIANTGGTGNLSDTVVQSQITVLNEDFRALAGTPGAPGFDTKVEFFLATTDPLGAPTNGIRRYTNATWFNDTGSYWTTIAWDTTRYLNIYTNSAGGGGTLGYVPDLPQGGSVLNTTADRVVILYSAFGRPATGGAPYNQGRTCTHEVGHFLGLFHTFQGGCGTASCYTTGDRICDTAAEQTARFGCPTTAVSCGTPDPIRNYMDYTDDSCMTNFTAEQAARIRCTLANYRPNLGVPGGPLASATVRNGPGNYNIYTSPPPVLGTSIQLQANVTGLTYTLGSVYWYLSPDTVPFPPYTILIDLNSTLVYQTPFVAPFFGLFMFWPTSIPNDPFLAGLSVSTQAILINGSGFGLTNAVDMTLGN
ncbi:MAG: zinc metalloprotease [Planctomycetota bacterium]